MQAAHGAALLQRPPLERVLTAYGRHLAAAQAWSMRDLAGPSDLR